MFFPMPFVSSVSVNLVVGDTRTSRHGDGSRPASVSCSIGVSALDSARVPMAAYFHATYKDTPRPVPGEDVLMMDTEGLEGEPHWSGHLVGTVITFSHSHNLHTLEGDPRFFFDNSRTPQVQGTGARGNVLLSLGYWLCSLLIADFKPRIVLQGPRSGVVVATTGKAERYRLCRLWDTRMA